MWRTCAPCAINSDTTYHVFMKFTLLLIALVAAVYAADSESASLGKTAHGPVVSGTKSLSIESRKSPVHGPQVTANTSKSGDKGGKSDDKGGKSSDKGSQSSKGGKSSDKGSQPSQGAGAGSGSESGSSDSGDSSSGDSGASALQISASFVALTIAAVFASI